MIHYDAFTWYKKDTKRMRSYVLMYLFLYKARSSLIPRPENIGRIGQYDTSVSHPVQKWILLQTIESLNFSSRWWLTNFSATVLCAVRELLRKQLQTCDHLQTEDPTARPHLQRLRRRSTGVVPMWKLNLWGGVIKGEKIIIKKK